MNQEEMIKSNTWVFHSPFNNDHHMPTDDIKVVEQEKNIYLEGKYLKEVQIKK